MSGEAAGLLWAHGVNPKGYTVNLPSSNNRVQLYQPGVSGILSFGHIKKK
jgi:hypothetical protein